MVSFSQNSLPQPYKTLLTAVAIPTTDVTLRLAMKTQDMSGYDTNLAETRTQWGISGLGE